MLAEHEKNILLELITRLCKDESNYFNSNFAENKLYIDGVTSYLTKEEKYVVSKWMKENNIKDFNEEK